MLLSIIVLILKKEVLFTQVPNNVTSDFLKFNLDFI